MQSNSEVFGAVKMTFNVGENPAQFHRDPFFGLASLVIALQPGNDEGVTVSHGGHTVEIDKVGPPAMVRRSSAEQLHRQSRRCRGRHQPGLLTTFERQRARLAGTAVP
jgi:hypothetical protein